jgi:hypothetical protein
MIRKKNGVDGGGSFILDAEVDFLCLRLGRRRFEGAVRWVLALSPNGDKGMEIGRLGYKRGS